MSDLWHTPRPGPGYWEWRCLTCDQPVDDHPNFWLRLTRAFFGGAR